MKKSIFVILGVLIIAMFLIGCTPEEKLSAEEQQTLDSELSQMSDEQLDQVIEESESQEAGALAGQAYSKYKSIPRASKQAVLVSAYKAKATRAAKCIWQDYAGGIKDCGIKSDGKGGTINCNYQKYAGGLECPQNYDCIYQDYAGGIKGQCVEKQCTPKTCVYQAYAGGIKDCGIKDDGCGGTINCNYQAYAGGLECPSGYDCLYQAYAGGVKSQCVEEQCTPKECVYQDYAGGVKDCGIKEDGCGGTINCNYQAYAGGLECPSGYNCVYQDYAGGIKGECIAQ